MFFQSFVGTFVFLAVVSGWANQVRFHSFGLGAADNIEMIMRSNPPLPIGKSSQEKPQTLQVTYFSGTNEFAGLNDNEFRGGAIELGVARRLSSRWTHLGVFRYTFFGADNVVDGTVSTTHLEDIKAHSFEQYVGFQYDLFRQRVWVPGITFIFGTSIRYMRFSQRFRQEDGILDSGSPFTGTLLDFDMEVNPLLFAGQLGGTVAWSVSTKWKMTFFGFYQLPISSECREYKVTTIRTDIEGDKTGTGECPNGEKGIEFSGSRLSGGFRVEYLPWKMSVNVSAPLLKAAIDSFNDQETTLMSFSWTL